MASSRFPAHVMVASALGGRVLYAWMWYWWAVFCLVAVKLRECMTKEDASSVDRLELLVLVGVLIHFTYRIFWFLTKQSHRSLTIQVPVGLFLRGVVWFLPLVGAGAIISPFVFE